MAEALEEGGSQKAGALEDSLLGKHASLGPMPLPPQLHSLGLQASALLKSAHASPKRVVHEVFCHFQQMMLYLRPQFLFQTNMWFSSCLFWLRSQFCSHRDGFTVFWIVSVEFCLPTCVTHQEASTSTNLKPDMCIWASSCSVNFPNTLTAIKIRLPQDECFFQNSH